MLSMRSSKSTHRAKNFVSFRIWMLRGVRWFVRKVLSAQRFESDNLGSDGGGERMPLLRSPRFVASGKFSVRNVSMIVGIMLVVQRLVLNFNVDRVNGLLKAIR